MPNCFQLTRKGEKEPRKLQEIDNELWVHFEGAVPETNDKWYYNWYNTVGLLLSCGKRFEEIFDVGFCDRLSEVILYLDEYYTSDSWYEMK